MNDFTKVEMRTKSTGAGFQAQSFHVGYPSGMFKQGFKLNDDRIVRVPPPPNLTQVMSGPLSPLAGPNASSPTKVVSNYTSAEDPSMQCRTPMFVVHPKSVDCLCCE